MMTRRKIINRLRKKAKRGQLHRNDGVVSGGCFIWIMDAADVVESILKEESGKTT